MSTPREAGKPETQALVTRSHEIVFGRFRLEVIAGPEPGASCESTGQEVTIGSAAQNHLVTKDPAVSRHHCAITATTTGFLLRDLGSTNGTALGGYRIESAYLSADAVIKVGTSLIRFELLDDETREPLSAENHYGHILGQSAAMRRIFAVLPRLAASDSTVLIEGETGTGKGLVAKVLHEKSARAEKPFVVVDCSAIPPTLIEAELFGHTKGAFTGAVSARAGAFEGANGGTVFLDEIGELRLDMQPKLLRALEERVIRRIGSLDPVRLDIRVVAATNRDLRREVNQGAAALRREGRGRRLGRGSSRRGSGTQGARSSVRRGYTGGAITPATSDDWAHMQGPGANASYRRSASVLVPATRRDDNRALA